MSWLCPPYYRFCPEDEDLIGEYLWKKVHKRPLPADFILDEDVYRTEPWRLPRYFKFGNVGENYYFSKVPSEVCNSRLTRKAGNGYWHMNGQSPKIYIDGRLAGYKKALKYMHREGNNEVPTKWIMYEYRLHYTNFVDTEETVLYRIQQTGKEDTYDEDDLQQDLGADSGEVLQGEDACSSSIRSLVSSG